MYLAAFAVQRKPPGGLQCPPVSYLDNLKFYSYQTNIIVVSGGDARVCTWQPSLCNANGCPRIAPTYNNDVCLVAVKLQILTTPPRATTSARRTAMSARELLG
jgi:hypothetical protein